MFSCGNYGFKPLYIICAVAGFGLPKKERIYFVWLLLSSFARQLKGRWKIAITYFSVRATTDLKYQNLYMCCLWNLSFTSLKIMI